MSLYSGNSNVSVDLISRLGISREEIQKITDYYISPRIGELKFTSNNKSYDQLGLQVLGNMVRVTGDFDGWTYPDGKNYYKENFPMANSIYKTNEYSDFFQVPTLKEFIKNSTSNLELQQYQIPENKSNVVLKHNHGLTNSGTLDKSFTIPDGFVFYASDNYTTQETIQYFVGNDDDGNPVYATVPKVHNGNATSNKVPIPLDVTMTIGDLNTIFSEGISDQPRKIGTAEVIMTNGDFQPEYFNMPTMIYIGKPVNKNYPDATIFTVEFKYKAEDYTETTYSINVMEYNTAFPPNIPIINGYIFNRWSSNEYMSVRKNLTGEYSIKAIYDIQKYNVNFYYGKGNLDVKKLVLNYLDNALDQSPTEDQVKVPGYLFLGWNISIVELECVKRNMEVYAQYSIKQYSITDESINGRIEGAGEYDYDSTVNLHAIPNIGYKFIKWEDNDSTDSYRQIIVTKNITLKAIFQQQIITSTVFYRNAKAHEFIPNVVLSDIEIQSEYKEYQTEKTIKQYFDDYPGKPLDFNTFTYSVIDWGDSTFTKVNKEQSSQKYNHSYDHSGTYNIQIKYVLIVQQKTTVSTDGIGFEILLDNGKSCTRSSISQPGVDISIPIRKSNSILDVICCKTTYQDGSFLIDNGIYPQLINEIYYFYKENKSLYGIQFIENKTVAHPEDLNVSYIKAGQYDFYSDSACILKEDDKIKIEYDIREINHQKVYSMSQIWFNLAGTTKNHFDGFETVYSVSISWK